MRKFVTLASVIVLAVGAANCSSSDASNSAGHILPMSSPVSPSMLEARGGNGGGKGGGSGSPNTGSGTSTVSYRVVSEKEGGPTGVSWGDTITFDVFTTATSSPSVDLRCYQNGVEVYWAVWPLTPNPTLSSVLWQGGSASCTAKLSAIDSGKLLASISFTAAG